MFAAAIRDVILGNAEIVERLGQYTFETGSAPEIGRASCRERV